MKIFYSINSKGVALITVMLILVIVAMIFFAMTFQFLNVRLMTVNEQDYLVASNHAEGVTQWIHRYLLDRSAEPGFQDFSRVLAGPDWSDPADDFLPGLRDLSLSSTSAFNNVNENTASALVEKDFGDGLLTYEAIRLIEGKHRILAYVRLDDNYDESPLPDNPLQDRDRIIRATVVAEYPVVVDSSGTELEVNRGRVRKIYRLMFGPPDFPALSSGGSLAMNGNVRVCGDCGSVYARYDLQTSGTICRDALASGNISGTADVSGRIRKDIDPLPLPVVNPYDSAFVPSIETFDHSLDSELSSHSYLQCRWSETDPGASKYFALVFKKIENSQIGLVFKAYWNKDQKRWEWRLIDNLSENNFDVKLDDCGRVADTDGEPGVAPDPNAGIPVRDGGPGEFYGFRTNTRYSETVCTTDSSFSVLANNDFNRNNFPLYGGGYNADPRIPPLPGVGSPDGILDLTPQWIMPKNRAVWHNVGSTFYSPLYNSVLFFHGNVRLTAGWNKLEYSPVVLFNPNRSTVTPPSEVWRLSILTTGNLEALAASEIRPASWNYAAGLIAGRDLRISGSAISSMEVCPADRNLCTSSPPVRTGNGLVAAHEQIAIAGNSQILGFVMAEEGSTCSDEVDGPSTISGNASIRHDCTSLSNPWAAGHIEVLSWQELQ